MFVRGDYRGKLYHAALLTLLLILSGCGFSFGPAGPEPTPAAPTSEPRALVPTFTPSPVAPPTPTTAPLPPTDIPAPAEPTAEAAVEPTLEITPTATSAPQAKLIVNNQAVNARSGPSTTYGLVGSAEANQTFDIVAKNPAGDWWQVCCINGQQAWIFGQLARTENAEAVPVAADIPAPPIVAAQPTTPPAAPTPEPQVAAPPPSSDPCAGIGDDGCKFELREGPKFAPNGGTEIKLQLIFVHSGVEGGQPQGSYFVVMLKNGEKLPINDSERSIAKSSRQGTLGPYNYEYKIGLDGIPGNNVAGNYVMYVLDGNGVRDSQDISFTIPEGQGEVWIKWDQG